MTNTDTRSPFSRRGFVAASIVVGVILLAAIIVLVTSITRGADNDNAGPTGAPTSTAAPTSNPSEMSVCGLPDFEEVSSLKSAPDNKWDLVGTVAAPTDPEGAGPGLIEDGFRSCYSHTAEGALFAAVNFVALGTDSRNSSRIYELLADGPAKEKVKAASETVTPSTSRIQVTGFKVNSYSATDATIDVAWKVTSEGDALVSVPTVLHWEDGDWKIVITDSGAPIAPAPLTNLGGYIPWAGV